jgi:hypothetical protein
MHIEKPYNRGNKFGLQRFAIIEFALEIAQSATEHPKSGG